MKTGIIYRATNKINGKVYIGQTIKTLEKRRAAHILRSKKEKYKNIKFYNAINKYGIDNFIWEVLYKDIPIEKLDVAEMCAIYTFGGIGENGYNLSEGGKTQIRL